MARKDQLPDLTEEKVLMHLTGAGQKIGERNERGVLVKLYCSLELVFILRTEFWMVRNQHFVSLTRYCPFSVVAILLYQVFLEASAVASEKPKVPGTPLVPKP